MIFFILLVSALTLYQLDLPSSYYEDAQIVPTIDTYAIYLINIFNVPPMAHNYLGNVFLGFSVIFGYLATKVNIPSEDDPSLYYPEKHRNNF
jgi:hypothetical protein